MTDTAQLRQLLNDIQHELQQLDLWQAQSPAPDDFNSSTPFFADTMDFDQWLQWVFVARFNALLDASQPLPHACSTAPMAEEAFKADLYQGKDVSKLVRLLASFDSHFAEQ